MKKQFAKGAAKQESLSSLLMQDEEPPLKATSSLPASTLDLTAVTVDLTGQNQTPVDKI